MRIQTESNQVLVGLKRASVTIEKNCGGAGRSVQEPGVTAQAYNSGPQLARFSDRSDPAWLGPSGCDTAEVLSDPLD